MVCNDNDEHDDEHDDDYDEGDDNDEHDDDDEYDDVLLLSEKTFSSQLSLGWCVSNVDSYSLV